MSKKIINDINEINDDSSIELSKTEKPIKIKKEKPPKIKKDYVLTDARKAQFDKARIIRQENIDIKKIQKELENDEYNKIKEDLAIIKKANDKRKKVKELLKLKKEVEEEASSSSEEEEEEIIKKPTRKSKPKPKPKKKVVYESSESEEEEEEIKPKKVFPSYKRPSMQYF